MVDIISYLKNLKISKLFPNEKMKILLAIKKKQLKYKIKSRK